MKTIQAYYTYLITIEVPDETEPDEIEELLDREAPAVWWNDREWYLVEDRG